MRYLLVFVLFIGFGCKEHVPIPKPRMYPRIVLPQGEYMTYTSSYCDFSFEFKDFAQWQRDTLFFDEIPADSCWFTLDIPEIQTQLHCSYYGITKENNLDKLLNDAFNLASKHNIKANYRRESLIENTQANIEGLLFEIEGPVATPIQFYLTDKEQHFFRGSLYFNAKVNPDSTKILLDFLKPDIEHMINTFRWKQS